MTEHSLSFIKLTNVPNDYGLLRSKDLILKALKDDNAVVSMEYDKNAHGEVSMSTVLVQLRNSENVEVLLQKPYIELEYQFKLHKILLTKPRTKVTTQDIHQGSSTSVSATSTSTSATSTCCETVAFSGQRNIFCARIPVCMYNREALRYHFSRFGYVEKILPPYPKSYAIIYFRDHNAALRAIESGGRIDGRDERMLIKWSNKDERKNNPTGTAPPGEAKFSNQRNRTFQGEPNRQHSFTSNESQKIATLQSHTSNWNQIFNKEKAFFSEPYKRCVLVQNAPGFARITSGDRLRVYFENLSHCGGKVVSMTRILDGILVEFEDEETANSVLVNEHVLDSLPLRTFAKTIPSIHESCFVVEGDFENVNTLEAWIECAGYSADDFVVECHSENALYLLHFFAPVDYQQLLNFVREVPLENIKPKIRQLTRPDCVLVKGLANGITDDIIKFTFMNKSKTGGGRVTMIKRRPESKSAIVYFSHWQDAVNVIEKSSRVMIENTEVEVCLWYNHSTRVLNKKKTPKAQSKATDRARLVHAFEQEIDCDSDIIEYIKSSNEPLVNLRQDLEQLALIDFSESEKAKIKFTPNFKNLNPGMNQVSFEEDCSKLLQNFLEKFSTGNGTFHSANLNQLLKSHIWTETAGIIQVEVDENVEAIQVFARWNHPSLGGAKVSGLKHEVQQVIKWLKMKCDVGKENIHLSPENFRVFSEFKIIDEVTSKYRNSDIRIRVDSTSYCVFLEGSFDLIKQVKENVEKYVQNVGMSQLSFLDRQQVDFLRDVFAQHTSFNIPIRDAIQLRLQQHNIKAFLRLQPNFTLVYYKNEDLRGVTQYLSEYIAKREVQLKQGFSQLIQSQDWTRLEQDIDESQKGKVRLLKDKQNSKLILVGVKSSVSSAYRRITEHIKDNIHEERKIFLDGVFASFLQLFPDEIQANIHLAAVNWKVAADKRSEIFIKGKSLDVAKAEAWLDDQKGSIKRKAIQISEPGMSHYFQDIKGKEFLRTTQTVCKCIIFINSPHSSQPSNSSTSSHSSSTVASQSMPKKTRKIFLSAKLPGIDVTIHVIQDDITDQRCDAIVNASNKELELRNAGVSGAILNKGGASIQQAMDVARNRLGGNLTVGSAEITSAGNLPCKKIIHVVGPEWSSTSKQLASNQLTMCIFSCLSECDRYNLKSVAIPAISCGIFGGKATECVQIILGAIKKYLASQESSVKEVFLIEMNNQEVLNAFLTEAARITGSTSSKAAVQVSRPPIQHDMPPQFHPTPSRFPPSFSAQTTPLQVSLKQGDIASVRADVIVTSCTPSTFPSCSGSATTKALLAVAGVGLKDECQQIAYNDSLKVGDVKPTSGYNLNCSEVFHILLDEYNGSNEDDLTAAIQTCLLMADEKGYSSIAFPAVGTGGMKYPASMLASLLMRQVHSFEGSSLKKVEFVIHFSDANAISAFTQIFGGYQWEKESQQDFNNTSQSRWYKDRISVSPSARSLERKTVSQSQTGQRASSNISHGIVLQVKHGDILQTSCEALLCPTNQYDLSRGQLSQMLLQFIGPHIVHQCQNPLHQSQHWRVIQVGARFKFIIFTDSPSQPNVLETVLSSVLLFAESNLKVQSLTLPAISTGNAGLDSTVVARSMTSAFQKFHATNPQYLKRIEVVIYDQKRLLVFQREIANRCPNFVLNAPSRNDLRLAQPLAKPRVSRTAQSWNEFYPKISPKPKVVEDGDLFASYVAEIDESVSKKSATVIETFAQPSPSSIIPIQRSATSVCTVTIDLCSDKDRNIDEAEKRIRKEVEEKSMIKRIRNDIITKLTFDEEKEIMRLERRSNVAVWTNNQRTELVISGLKDDVYKASECVAEILQDYRAALTYAEYVKWQYRDPWTSELMEFPLRLSGKIESQYKENENGRVQMNLQIAGEERKCKIDFSSMTVFTSDLPNFQIVRLLKTESSADDDLPSHWTAMEDSQPTLVALSSASKEYKEVLNKFAIFSSNQRGRSNQVVSVERIQNPTLYKQFLAQKRKVEARLKQRGVQHPVTKELFHGTSADVCARIYKDGFDRSHCGKNGTAYGRGVYFATDAQYSKGYVKPDSSNRCQMFLAEVITGEYCQGNSSLNVLPMLPGTDTQYDSAVNNVNSPSMYVVFKDASVYPSYIVTYT